LHIPEFESDQPGIINRPAVMLRQPPCRQRQTEIPVAAAYPSPSSSNANSLCCALSAKSPELPAATPADFDPNGFRSSSDFYTANTAAISSFVQAGHAREIDEQPTASPPQ
jgi:hypothetical protein